jgi:hypothetical protein
MLKNIKQFALATTMAAAVVVGMAGSAIAGPVAPANPAVTRAALDPALVAGRGASVKFLEQEAEKAPTNGTIIGPQRTAYTLPAVESGRSAVRLLPGQFDSSRCRRRPTRSLFATAFRTRQTVGV